MSKDVESRISKLERELAENKRRLQDRAIARIEARNKAWGKVLEPKKGE